MTALRLGSLFSGYGGTDMAVAAGLSSFGRTVETVWHSDIKPAAVTLLAHRHPDVPNLGDLLDIDYSTVSPIDVLAASWPCQPHSAAGKRLGEKDPRALWPAVVRAVEATRPAIFFGENVARISGNGELRRVVRSLAHHGYVGAWRCVRASDVGACHRRDRCFVVAVDLAAYALSGGRPSGWTRPQASESFEFGGPHAARSDHGHLTLLPSPCESDGRKGGPGMRGSSGDLMLPSAVMDFLPTPCERDWREGSEFVPRPEKYKLTHTIADLDQRDELRRFGKYAAAVARHEQVLGRPVPEPTQISPRTGRPQLAPRFVEWMQMLPEGWVTDVPGLTRNQQLSLLGDGVVPRQAAFAYVDLLTHLGQRLAQEAAA